MMASIDPWRLWQAEIKLTIPQGIALSKGDRGSGGEGWKEDSGQANR